MGFSVAFWGCAGLLRTVRSWFYLRSSCCVAGGGRVIRGGAVAVERSWCLEGHMKDTGDRPLMVVIEGGKIIGPAETSEERVARLHEEALDLARTVSAITCWASSRFRTASAISSTRLASTASGVVLRAPITSASVADSGSGEKK